MELDIEHRVYERSLYDTYIYGSAEVVGLMCLRVFTADNPQDYDRLKAPAKRLGAAFQKVNFLRDISSDYHDRGRVYFPGVEFGSFSDREKQEIEAEIAADFDAALVGIRALPRGSRLGVHCAYVYFKNLLERIQATEARRIANERIRVPNTAKVGLMLTSAVRHKLGVL
jgi:phytoene/squalene synthetase